MKHTMFIDLETYSEAPIADCGAYRYADDPSFEILLLAYSVDFGPVEVLDLSGRKPIPEAVAGMIVDPAYEKHAYNASFELTCLGQYLGDLDPDQWRCTMIHGLYAGFPAGLAAIGDALNLAQDSRKLATGRDLIRYFCVPCEPTKSNLGRTRNLPHHDPDKWALFVEYNRRDVEAEQAIARKLEVFPVPDAVWRQWATDIRINRRGVGIDIDLVDGALAIGDQEVNALTAEAQALTGLANPGSREQLLGWLRAHGHPDLEDIRAETVTDTMSNEKDPAVRRVLEIRQMLGKTSTAKYVAMAKCWCSDGRARGLLQFYGANRTGRWAGRLVQVQNLPRTHLPGIDAARAMVKALNRDALTIVYGNTQDTLSQLIRTAFVPQNGRIYIDVDFSAIEARVIAWLAQEQWRLDVFRTTGKIYEASASMIYGVPVGTIAKGRENYHLRQRGKVAELALGYQGGVGAMRRMDVSHALDEMDDDAVQSIVAQWRAASPNIPKLWWTMQEAAMGAVANAERTVVQMGQGPQIVVGREMRGGLDDGLDALTITLPSGRKLYYEGPHVARDRHGSESIGYMGVDQVKGVWAAQETYGGKLVENCTQAIARDCLAEAIERLEAAGYHVVFHVHDEVVVEAERAGSDEEMLARVVAIMCELPAWAQGLPLNADGWVGDYYTKD